MKKSRYFQTIFNPKILFITFLLLWRHWQWRSPGFPPAFSRGFRGLSGCCRDSERGKKNIWQLKIRSQSLQSFMQTSGINCAFILTFANRLAGWPLFTLMNAVNSKILIRIKQPLVYQRVRLSGLSSGLLDAQFCLCGHIKTKYGFHAKQLKINCVNFSELGNLMAYTKYHLLSICEILLA